MSNITIDLSNNDSGITIETPGTGEAASVAINVISASLLAETSNRVSADAALSTRINVVSALGAGSVTSQEVSVAVAVETSNRRSADAALSVRIDAISGTGGGGSVTSAAYLSALNRLSGLST